MRSREQLFSRQEPSYLQALQEAEADVRNILPIGALWGIRLR